MCHILCRIKKEHNVLGSWHDNGSGYTDSVATNMQSMTDVVAHDPNVTVFQDNHVPHLGRFLKHGGGSKLVKQL